MMGYRQVVRHRILIPVFPGSNPGSLTGCMLTIHATTYVFHMYLNPWLSDSSIWVPPFATRTILLRTVLDRPAAFAAECGKAEDRLVLDDGCPVIC